MTSTNMLPTALEYAETVQQLYPLNEITQINAEDFHLKKISDLQTELTNEADHYRQVAKKNIKEHTPLHTSQLSALVHFLLDCHQQPWQELWLVLGLLQVLRLLVLQLFLDCFLLVLLRWVSGSKEK